MLSSFCRWSPSGKALGDLLQQPGVAVRIAEPGERAVGLAIGFRSAHLLAILAVEDLPNIRAGVDEILSSLVDVGDDQVGRLSRTRFSRGQPDAELDRAGRPRRRQLDDSQGLAGRDVGVEPPTQ